MSTAAISLSPAEGAVPERRSSGTFAGFRRNSGDRNSGSSPSPPDMAKLTLNHLVQDAPTGSGERQRPPIQQKQLPVVPQFQGFSPTKDDSQRSDHGAFSTPLINGMFSKQQQIKPEDTSRSNGRAWVIPKDGTRKLEFGVIDHPKLDGVIVSELGLSGACACAGLKVGDHITHINGCRARDHRSAIFLADSADNSVCFSLADATTAVDIEREDGEGTGVTIVTNTQGVGVVVVQLVPGRAAARAGLEVGHVILSMDGQLVRDHRQVVRSMDDSVGRISLVVAKRKLTEANVLNQHMGQVPCDIVIESGGGGNGLGRRFSRGL